MRNQELAAKDITTVADLYRDGATLAQLGRRFAVSPNAVRRALMAACVVMRSGGSKLRR
jgi:hypothetical protein